MSDTTQRRSLRRSLEQERAKFAYAAAETGKAEVREGGKAYKSYVKKIPMLIKTNGLAATFAFVKAKSESNREKKGYAYDLIYRQTLKWLRKSPAKGYFPAQDDGKLIEVLIARNSQEYRHLSSEVMALFGWLKRAAEGVIEGDDDEK
jgi:CRISPR-associated protein Cmr5